MPHRFQINPTISVMNTTGTLCDITKYNKKLYEKKNKFDYLVSVTKPITLLLYTTRKNISD